MALSTYLPVAPLSLSLSNSSLRDMSKDVPPPEVIGRN